MSNKDKQPNYTSKFGLVNILNDEEKSSYKKFNDRLLTMEYGDLVKLNMGIAGDVLTSEQRDLVAWQFKIRELDEMARRGVDLATEFSVDNIQPVGYDPTTPDLQKLQVEERNRIEGMSLDELEYAKKLVDDTPVVIHKNQMHNINGGGINMACNKYIVIDENGDEVLVNNRNIQEMFRKRYIKAMSDVTGFDFTKYNLDDDVENPDLDYTAFDNPEPLPSNVSFEMNINDDEYEDD